MAPRRPGPPGVALLLLAPLALLGALAPAAPAQAPAAVELVALAAGYGTEDWKDEPVVPAVGGAPLPVQPPVGVPGLGVYENPYLNATALHQGTRVWLGYNLTATFALPPAEAAGRYVLARLETPLGPVPAKMARAAEGRFTAQFDLDGENGQGFPEVPPGPLRLVVEVYEDRPPTVADERVGVREFPLMAEPASLGLDGLRYPEAALPGYADVGPGNTTVLRTELAAPGEPLQVAAFLGAPDAPAVLVAWHKGERAVLAQGRTDAAGILRAEADPAAAMGGNASGLVVLEAHLDGSLGRLASAAAAVPVSAHPTRVVRYDFQPREPLGPADLSPTDLLVVAVEDATAGDDAPLSGNLTVFDPGGDPLLAVPFDAASFAPGATTRNATVPALLLRSLDRDTYRLVALFLTADQRLYSLAHAVRGYGVGGGDATALPGAEGTLELVVRNFNNNFDDQRDPGMALPVRVRVTGLPGNGSWEGDVRVEESGEHRIALPFAGPEGLYPVTINTTSGELAVDLAGTVRIEAPRSGFGLPGFDAALAALAAASAAAAAGYRARMRR